MNKKKNSIFSKGVALLLSTLLLSSSFPVVAYAATKDHSPEKAVLGESQTTSKEENKRPETEEERKHEEEQEDSDQAKVNYDIFTPEDLLEISNLVNKGEFSPLAEVYLRNDIDLSAIAWIPIGNTPQEQFTQKFHGNGYRISGLKRKPEEKGGLFGYINHAEIEQVTLVAPEAPLSTSGFYYSATSCIMTECFTETPSGATIASPNKEQVTLSRAYTLSTWTGNFDTSWYDIFPNETEYFLYTAAQLAGLAQLSKNNSFEGINIHIMEDMDLVHNSSWPGIGTRSSSRQFNGNIFGNNHVIYNLGGRNAFIEGMKNAQVQDLVFEGAQMYSSSTQLSRTPITIFYGSGSFSTIRNITIMHSETKVTATRGYYFANGFGEKIGNVMLEDIALIDVRIESGTDESPVMLNLGGRSHNIAIYNNTMELTKTSAQSALLNSDRFTTVDGFLSVQNHVTAQGPFLSSLISSSSDVSIKNGFISDTGFINTSNTCAIRDFNRSNVITESYLEQIRVDQFSNITVSASPSNMPRLKNTYWSQAEDFSANPNIFSKISKPMDTTTLTDGMWSPDFMMWTSTFGHLPQVTSLLESRNPWIRELARVSTMTIASTKTSENLYDSNGATKIRLMKETMDGQPIVWDFSAGGTDIYEIPSEKPSEYTYLMTDEDSVGPFTITGSVPTALNGEGFTKTFENVTLRRGELHEIEQMRFPTTNGINGSLSPLRIFFEENIALNSGFSGDVVLEKEENGSWTTVTSIPANSVSMLLAIGYNDVQVQVPLDHDGTYRITYPAGMLVEKAGNALNKEISYEFKTPAVGMPVIDILQNSIERNMDEPTTISDLLKMFKVYKSEGGNVLFDYAVSPHAISAYVGEWNAKNPANSMQNALQSDQFPEGVNTVKYYMEDESIFQTPLPGVYRLHIMVKNETGGTATGTVFLQYTSTPTWGIKPKPVVHIPWTSDLFSIKRAALQNATAFIIGENGEKDAYSIGVTVNGNDAKSLKSKTAPSKVRVELTAGTEHVPVTVYLDKTIALTYTPGPYHTAKTTPRQIENAVNAMLKNVKHYDLEFEHWDNDYRVPGAYYVDFYTKPQYVTMCTDPSCDSVGDHPSDSIGGDLLVIVHDTTVEETTHFWGDTVNAFLEEYDEDVYQKKTLVESPKSYYMNKEVLEHVKENTFSQLQVRYHNAYQWNFYSDALSTNIPNEVYPLRMQRVTNQAVTPLLKGNNNALIEFEYSGELPGTVELELFPEKFGLSSETEQYGLYQHDESDKELRLIAVGAWTVDGHIAFQLSEIFPTTYVVAPMAKTASVVAPVVSETTYASAKSFGTKLPEEEDFAVVYQSSDTTVLPTISEGKTLFSPISAEREEKGKTGIGLIPVILVVVVVVSVVAVVLYWVKRRTSYEN